jgi:thiosulfate dehydrogenase (quinone) large subunit
MQPEGVEPMKETAATVPWHEGSDAATQPVLSHSALPARPLLRYVANQARLDGVYLVPLRLFIGLGWLRAFAEKAADPGWSDGTRLATFLTRQVHDGAVAFPLYEQLITSIFLPHARTLGWIIMAGQLLAGLAIMSGTLTNLALLGGLFMNLNFLLAGVPDPSAFYLVIQAVLFLANTGAILGADSYLSRVIHQPLLVARAGPRPAYTRSQRRLCMIMTLLSLVIALYGLAHISDFTAAGSVHDPAMILTVLASIGALLASIAYLRMGTP